MDKSKFLKDHQAEQTTSLSKLVTLYIVALWIPIIISLIADLIGIFCVVDMAIDEKIKLGIIIGICVFFFVELFFIIAFQSFIRIQTYHLERINYNTALLIETVEKLNLNNKENNSDSNIENDILEEQFNNAKKGIELMISLKQINDKQFNLYIESLEKLETYNYSNLLIPIYKQKYEFMKSNFNPTEEDEKQIVDKLSSLVAEKKISQDKYKEYSDLFINISKIISIDDKKNQYKKLLVLLNSYDKKGKE